MNCFHFPYHVVSISCIYPPLLLPKSDDGAKMVIAAVSKVIDVSPDDILSRVQKREYVTGRQLVMFFMRKYFKSMSLVRVGKVVNRDYTTVIYSCEVVENLRDTDKAYRRNFERIDEELKNTLILLHETTA